MFYRRQCGTVATTATRKATTMANYEKFTVREAHAYEFSVRFDAVLRDRIYDVCVDVLSDDYDVEVYDEAGDPVDASWFASEFGFDDWRRFAEMLVDGFHLDGPSGFELRLRKEVLS
jgi:hypothetical protein